MTTTHDNENSRIPKTMAEALDFENPYEALMALSSNSQERVTTLSLNLIAEINGNSFSECIDHRNDGRSS